MELNVHRLIQVLLLLLCGHLVVEFAAKCAWGSPHDAVVRISNRSGMGSGCVFLEDEQHYWILTNAHVAGRRGRAVNVEFWKSGHLSRPIRGVVGASWMTRAHRDIAMVAVRKDALAGIQPAVIPLAERDEQIDFRHFATCGCPGGVWANELHGYAFSADKRSGDVIHFYPSPAPGRSGSALVTPDGSRIIGLIAWRSDGGNRDGRHARGGYGIAMTHREIWAAWRNETTSAEPRPEHHRPAALLRVMQVGDQVQATATDQRGITSVRLATIVAFEKNKKVRLRDYLTQIEWVTPVEHVQCPDGRCWPWQRPGPQPQPQPYGGDGGNTPWPDLPPDLGGGSSAAPRADYVERSEYASTIASIRSEMEQSRGQAAVVSSGMTAIQGDVQAVKVEQAGLKEEVGKLFALATENEKVRAEVAQLKDDFFRKIAEHEGPLSLEEIKRIAKDTVKERAAEIRTHVDDSGGLVPWLVGGVVALTLAQLGVGGWQGWLINRGSKRLVRKLARRGGRAEEPFREGE